MKFSVDRIFIALCAVGLGVLCFISGVTALRYDWPPARLITQAYDSAEAWQKRLASDRKPAVPQQNFQSALANPDVQWNRDKAWGGYTLITTWTESAAYLLDMEGNIAHRWALPFSHVWPTPAHVLKPRPDNKIIWEKAHVFPNGDVLAAYISIGDTPYGYGMAKIDKDSRLLWKYDSHTHHDFYIADNGHIYALTQDYIKTPVKGFENLPFPLLADAVVILSPEGKELKKIRIMDALKDTPYELMLYYAKGWDQWHVNSIMMLEPAIAAQFPQFKAGDILVSIRNMNALAVINPDSGKVVWVGKGAWRGQHAAKFLPNGRMLVFDNRGHMSKGKTYSRVLEFDPKSLGVYWSLIGDGENPFYTGIVGRVQRLANGNTLVTSGKQSRMFEVTPEKEIVWDYRLPPVQKKPAKSKQGTSRDVTNAVIVSAVRYAPEELPFLTKNPAQ